MTIVKPFDFSRVFSTPAYADSTQKRYDKESNPNTLYQRTLSSSGDSFIKRRANVTFGAQTSSTTVTPQEKLARIAAQLSQHQLDAYYISPEDEHLNEYLPDNKKRIEWLTGFTGESAPLLVTPQKMYLYVDGRFHLQVDDEVDASVVDATKLGPDDSGDKCAIETVKKLSQNSAQGFRLGYDPFIVSPRRLKALKHHLGKTSQVTWVPITGNLVDPTWTQRPTLPSKQAFPVDTSISGKSTQDKLNSVRQEMQNAKADVLPLTRLDDIGWLYNIRGGDIPYNPVLESYAIVTSSKAYLFADLQKIPSSLQTLLSQQGVDVKPYDDYLPTLQQLLSTSPGNKPKVWVDKNSLTSGSLELIEQFGEVVEKDNPVTWQKAHKNDVEIQKMLEANFKASRAIIRHLAEVDRIFASGKPLSEEDVRSDLEAKYKQENDFVDLSFPTIPGIGTNSAIIHYSKADPKQIGNDGDFYLLDSGCQYLGGTTDTTRTTVFGTPKPDQIQRYTAVLKAHIACARLVFPDGTKGAQIDAVTRQPMWLLGLDFAHGTGHGVGAFLNVHEGPNRISKVGNVTFQPGMVTSIEPGYYEKDWGGIRLENLYYVSEDTSKPAFLGKKWYRFEPLTFVPFDPKLIDINALTSDEKQWLKDYHQKVWDKISPTLTNPHELAWLKAQCSKP